MDLKKVLMVGGMALVLGLGGVAMKCGGEGEAEAGEEGEEGHEAPAVGHEKPKAAGHEKPKAAGHGAAAAQDDGELVVAKQTHIVNVPGAKRGFLRCQFSLLVRDADLGKQLMTPDTPEETEAKAIVLGILQALSAEDMNEMQRPGDAREALLADITESLNDRFGGSPSSDKALPPRHREPIKTVFVTEWATQTS
jgi:hypothetical protein